MKRRSVSCAIVVSGSLALFACSSGMTGGDPFATNDPNGNGSGSGNGNGNGNGNGDGSGSGTGTGNGNGGSSDAAAQAHDSGSSTGNDAGSTPKDSGSTAQDTGTPNDGFDQFQHHNLDVINQYRATLGIAPLVLDKQLSAFALAGSQELSQDHTPHQHFITAGNNGSLWTSGFSGSAGENQGDPNGWYVMSSDPVQNELKQIDDIQKAMFDEGPGAGEAHGHYTNMMNAAYKRLGVGLLEVNGKLYLTNDFSQ